MRRSPRLWFLPFVLCGCVAAGEARFDELAFLQTNVDANTTGQQLRRENAAAALLVELGKLQGHPPEEPPNYMKSLLISTYETGKALVQIHTDTARETTWPAASDQIPNSGPTNTGIAHKILIPVVVLGFGVFLLKGPQFLVVFGKIFIFFGAQTFMNLYMKSVLSAAPVDAAHGLKGFPAAFAVTSLQMVTSFLLFVIGFAVLWFTPFRYKPKILTTRTEWFTIIIFSFTFTVNIALNNFSMALLPISVNLTIRSSTPLVTFVAQQVMSRIFRETPKQTNLSELALMLIGVGCAALAVVAKSSAQLNGAADATEEAHLILGVGVCMLSILAAAVNVVLAGVLGSSMSLNPLDTVLYMSIPAFASLLLPTFFISHMTNWPVEAMTDWQMLKVVAQSNPGTIGLAVLSGVFALAYNVLQYFIVQTLSTTYAAFMGNFNKAATIVIAVIIGLERMPQGKYGTIMILGVAGNILAFMGYGVMKAANMHRKRKSDSHS